MSESQAQQVSIVSLGGLAAGSLLQTAASYCGTNAGSVANNRDGYLLTTGAHAGDVEGLIPKSGSLLGTANFLKSQDEPWMEVLLKLAASLTGIEILAGLVNAEPDAAASSGKDAPGEYNNADLTAGAWFWFDAATDAAALCIGYRWTDVNVAKQVLDITLVAATERELAINVDADGIVHFSVDGTEVYASSEAIPDDVALIPVTYVIGNAKTLYVREITAGKKYS